MNIENFKAAQHAQALIIGKATIQAAYLPTSDEEADKAFILDAIDDIAIMTRKLTIVHDDGSPERSARLALGGTFCAKALSWSLKSMHRLACTLGIDEDDDVLESVQRVTLARKVLVRRELEHAVESIEGMARAEGLSVTDMLTRGDSLSTALREGVMASLAATGGVGLSKDFLGRMRSRLGIE